MKTYNYDGYEQILENVKSIIQSEPLTEVEKDSLITKIDTFQDEIENLLMGRGARAVSYDKERHTKQARKMAKENGIKREKDCRA